jgi:hypothetical protein
MLVDGLPTPRSSAEVLERLEAAARDRHDRIDPQVVHHIVLTRIGCEQES